MAAEVDEWNPDQELDMLILYQGYHYFKNLWLVREEYDSLHGHGNWDQCVPTLEIFLHELDVTQANQDMLCVDQEDVNSWYEPYHPQVHDEKPPQHPLVKFRRRFLNQYTDLELFRAHCQHTRLLRWPSLKRLFMRLWRVHRIPHVEVRVRNDQGVVQQDLDLDRLLDSHELHVYEWVFWLMMCMFGGYAEQHRGFPVGEDGTEQPRDRRQFVTRLYLPKPDPRVLFLRQGQDSVFQWLGSNYDGFWIDLCLCLYPWIQWNYNETVLEWSEAYRLHPVPN